MRDYVQSFYCEESMPYFITGVVSKYFFQTPEEAQSFFDNNPVSPGGGTLSPPQPLWWRINKDIFVKFMNSSFIQNFDAIGGAYLESPRGQGINSAVERKPGVSITPGSLGPAKPRKLGPKGKINLDLALYLTLLWQTYLFEHKFIVANQVLSELNKFQMGKVTEAQVLDFLSKLPPTQ